MSSAVVSTTAALGRHFVFEDEGLEPSSGSQGSRALLERAAPSTSLRAGEGGCPHISSQTRKSPAKILSASVTPASRLEIRPAPEMVSSGIAALDALTGGLPRGCLTEICGNASSGRTSLLLAALAAATRRGEFCALVDATDALDPQSAAASGIMLDRLLWVRCGESVFSRSSAKKARAGQKPRSAFSQEETSVAPAARQYEHCLEQVLRATDLLLESGGFGLIVLDLAELPPQAARRIPLTTWFRFRRAVENKSTILLAIEQQAIAGSCSSLLLNLGASDPLQSADKSAAEGRKKITLPIEAEYPAHAQLLTGLEINAELIRSRLERKPARSVAFASKTAWAG